MTVFTDKEKNFIKRAIVSTSKDLEGKEIDPTKREDLIEVIKTFRGRGYLTPRRADQGKDYDMYHNVLQKLGVKLKTNTERLLEQEQKRTKGIMERLNEIHTNKINSLENKLKVAKDQKEKAFLETENQIQLELDKLEKQKQNFMERLEITKTARERILQYKQKKSKEDIEKEEDGLMKCWVCGEWFNGDKGLKIHMKKVHPNEKSD